MRAAVLALLITLGGCASLQPAEPAYTGNYSYSHIYNGGPQARSVSVPEPETFGLFGLGIVGVVVARRRRKSIP